MSLARDDYPEHEKLHEVSELSQAIGEFLESCPYTLCEWNDRLEEYRPTHLPVNKLLADHFGIDLKKLEDEKDAMLAAMRAIQPS